MGPGPNPNTASTTGLATVARLERDPQKTRGGSTRRRPHQPHPVCCFRCTRAMPRERRLPFWGVLCRCLTALQTKRRRASGSAHVLSHPLQATSPHHSPILLSAQNVQGRPLYARAYHGSVVHHRHGHLDPPVSAGGPPCLAVVRARASAPRPSGSALRQLRLRLRLRLQHRLRLRRLRELHRLRPPTLAHRPPMRLPHRPWPRPRRAAGAAARGRPRRSWCRCSPE